MCSRPPSARRRNFPRCFPARRWRSFLARLPRRLCFPLRRPNRRRLRLRASWFHRSLNFSPHPFAEPPAVRHVGYRRMPSGEFQVASHEDMRSAEAARRRSPSLNPAAANVPSRHSGSIFMPAPSVLPRPLSMRKPDRAIWEQLRAGHPPIIHYHPPIFARWRSADCPRPGLPGRRSPLRPVAVSCARSLPARRAWSISCGRSMMCPTTPPRPWNPSWNKAPACWAASWMAMS